jgi:predicted negative regulator of RcsB-dependent stress response
MSNNQKIAVGVVILVLVVFFGYKAVQQKQMDNLEAQNATTTEQRLPSEATNSSDNALSQDAQAIDVQLQGLDADATVIDEGINDDATSY